MPVAFNERVSPLSAGASGLGTSMLLGYDFTGYDSRALLQAYDYVGATPPTLSVSGGAMDLVTLNGTPGVQPSVSGARALYASAVDYGLQFGTGDYTICFLFSTPASAPTAGGTSLILRFDNNGPSGMLNVYMVWDASGYEITIGGLGSAVSVPRFAAGKTVAIFIRRASGVSSAWKYVVGDDSAVVRRYSDASDSANWSSANARRLIIWEGATSGNKADFPVLHSVRTHGAALTQSEMTSYAADWWAVDTYSLDATSPTFTGSIATSGVTSSTITDTLPTASDNVAVAGYQGRINGGAWVDLAGPAATWTGLAALTSHTREYRAYDATPNYSALLSVTSSTYRAGASAGSILAATGPQDGNPAGWLYALAGTVPADTWLSYRILSGPTPTGGTLDAQPNGAASYTGPSPATLVIQPEANGVDTAEPITITLYDQPEGSDVTAPTLSAATAAAAGSASGTGSVTTDETGGTLYWIATTGASATAAAVKAGNSQAVTAAGAQSVTVLWLTPETTYRIHYLHRDAAGNDSTVLSSATFTTSAAPAAGAGSPTERWNGTQWVPGGVFRRGNGSGGFVTGGRPRRWNGTGWT